MSRTPHFIFRVSPGPSNTNAIFRLPSRWLLAQLAAFVFCSLLYGSVAHAQGLLNAGTLSFSPSSAAFGSVTTGSSKSITVTVKNSGGAAVSISAKAMHATGFSESGLSIPASLAAGKTLTMTLKFAPSSSGYASGYLLITSNATNQSVQYAVNGTGVKPAAISVTPSSIAFDSVATGTTNSQTVQIKNTGGQNLTISSVGNTSTSFKVSGLTTPVTIAPSSTKQFTIAFSPTSSGPHSGTITLGTNVSSAVITVSGTGGTATRTLSLSSSNLNFGNETVGGTSTLGVTLKNIGNSSLTVSSVSVSGTGFATSGGVNGITIAAGQSAQLNVTFSPKATGSVTGKVTLTSNAGNSPNTVSLAGAGVSSTAHSVALAWEASASSNVKGYYIYRSTKVPGQYARLNASVVTSLKYTDGSVSTGTTYYYVVTTVSNNGDESGYSAPVSAEIP